MSTRRAGPSGGRQLFLSIPNEGGVDGFTISACHTARFTGVANRFGTDFPHGSSSKMAGHQTGFRARRMRCISSNGRFVMATVTRHKNHRDRQQVSLRLDNSVASNACSFGGSSADKPVVRLTCSRVRGVKGRRFLIPFRAARKALRLRMSRGFRCCATEHLGFATTSEAKLGLRIRTSFRI